MKYWLIRTIGKFVASRGGGRVLPVVGKNAFGPRLTRLTDVASIGLIELSFGHYRIKLAFYYGAAYVTSSSLIGLPKGAFKLTPLHIPFWL
jgi:hypothetical protein